LYARDRVSELTLVPRDGSFSWSWVDVEKDSADDDGFDSRFDLRWEGTLEFNVLLPGEVDRARRSRPGLPQDDCDFLPSSCLGVCSQPLYCELPSNTREIMSLDELQQRSVELLSMSRCVHAAEHSL
jgi:hypothetical protein